MATEIKCRFCKAAVQVENVNLDRMLAKCGSCNSIFDISSQVPQAAAPAGQPTKRRERGNVPMPKNVTMESGGSSLSITRKWKTAAGCFLLFFALFWNGITWSFVVATLTGNMKGASGFTVLFLIPFVLVGLVTGYLALAFLINHTVIKVERSILSVSHGPLRWPGNKEVQVGDVVQLFCEEYEAYRQNHRPVYHYAVKAKTRGGGKILIVKGFNEAEQALFVEQELEHHLRIENQVVTGEI